MLLNKLPVLDKGYVAIVSTSNDGKMLGEISLMVLDDMSSLMQISSLTLMIKCPLFVQLYLSKFNLKIMNASRNIGDEIEAFLPDMTDVEADDHETSTLIADDIKRTTALFL